MSKELEALRRIRNVEVEIGNDHNTAIKVFEIGNDYDEHFRIIEKALKKLEELESRENNVMPVDDFVGDLGEHTADEVAKKLTALDIIIKKNITPIFFSSLYDNYDDYLTVMGVHNKQNLKENKYLAERLLTEDEFYLLKEVAR